MLFEEAMRMTEVFARSVGGLSEAKKLVLAHEIVAIADTTPERIPVLLTAERAAISLRKALFVVEEYKRQKKEETVE